MDLQICKDANDVARAVSDWCHRRTHLRRTTSVYVPAGRSPMPLYDLWRRSAPAFLDSLRFVQIDEVISGARQGMFHEFFCEQLPQRATQFSWIEQGEAQAELALLGLGVNGHVGFHEPGLPADFFSGCVRLSNETVAALGVEPGTWGLTYGVGAFMRCQAIAMIVTGESKHQILRRLIDVGGDFPAAYLRGHVDFTVFADRDAYG